jgi:hypothetical protein
MNGGPTHFTLLVDLDELTTINARAEATVKTLPNIIS